MCPNALLGGGGEHTRVMGHMHTQPRVPQWEGNAAVTNLIRLLRHRKLLVGAPYVQQSARKGEE